MRSLYLDKKWMGTGHLDDHMRHLGDGKQEQVAIAKGEEESRDQKAGWIDKGLHRLGKKLSSGHKEPMREFPPDPRYGNIWLQMK